ncbi:MAG: signal peptidase II [Butyrivibrio sp.]
MKKFLSYASGIIAVLLLVAADQVTKWLALTKLYNNEPYVIIKDVLELSYLRNDGAAWGVLSGKQTFFIIITFVMLAAAIFVFIKMPITPHYRGLRVVLCTLAAGAVGNLIDRIHNGYVHDFIYFKIINFPVFNFADICVTLSMIGLVIMILFVYKDKDWDFLKKKKAEEQPSDASGDEDGK